MTQSYEIQDTPTLQKILITTTGISKTELDLIDLPQNIILNSTLTPKTKLLITYKAIFTEKYIQALHWNIPIVSSDYLYDLTSNYKKYELKIFQGATFSTSGVHEDIFANFFIALGAKYEPNCNIFIDFLICDNSDSEKYNFCQKYDIPIIKTCDVFRNNYTVFLKKLKYDAKKLNPKAMFFEKTFYLDQTLPKPLFNRLRRVIIENEGTRISTKNDEVDFIITMNYDQYAEQQSKLIHHQYIFDCKDSCSLLYPEFYQVNMPSSRRIVENGIAVVDKTLPNYKELVNKLKSLDFTVKCNLDTRVTHYISRTIDKALLKVFSKTIDFSSIGCRGKRLEETLPFKVVTPEWIDQCLITLKHVKENKFLVGRLGLSLKRRSDAITEEKEMVFQFTSIPSYFKDEAIKKFVKHKIKFVDSEKFENCTHLLAGSINSSEKLFSSIVSGCWILRPDFIQDFENQPNFEFERYEWTSQPGMSSKDTKIAEAIRKWRERLQNGGNKPFHKWNVKIYCAEDKKENYTNLIVNGGGSMDESCEYTHVFVDKGYKQLVPEKNAKNSNYIFSYIFK